jgi:hypothetical protein
MGYLQVDPRLFVNHSKTIEISPEKCIYAVLCNTPLQYHTKIKPKYCSLVEKTVHPNVFNICFQLKNTNKTTSIILQPGSTLDQAFSCLPLIFKPKLINETPLYK